MYGMLHNTMFLVIYTCISNFVKHLKEYLDYRNNDGPLKYKKLLRITYLYTQFFTDAEFCILNLCLRQWIVDLTHSARSSFLTYIHQKIFQNVKPIYLLLIKWATFFNGSMESMEIYWIISKILFIILSL